MRPPPAALGPRSHAHLHARSGTAVRPPRSPCRDPWARPCASGSACSQRHGCGVGARGAHEVTGTCKGVLRGADISGTHRHGASHVCRAQWILCLRGVPRLHSARHSSVARGTSLCCIPRLRRACHTPAKRATSSWCTLHGCTVPHAHGASCVQELCATAPVQGAPHTLRALCITRGRHPAAGGRSRAGCHAQGLAQPQPGRPHGPVCVTGAWLLLAFQTSRQRLTGSGDV